MQIVAYKIDTCLTYIVREQHVTIRSIYSAGVQADQFISSSVAEHTVSRRNTWQCIDNFIV